MNLTVKDRYPFQNELHFCTRYSMFWSTRSFIWMDAHFFHFWTQGLKHMCDSLESLEKFWNFEFQRNIFSDWSILKLLVQFTLVAWFWWQYNYFKMFSAIAVHSMGKCNAIQVRTGLENQSTKDWTAHVFWLESWFPCGLGKLSIWFGKCLEKNLEFCWTRCVRTLMWTEVGRKHLFCYLHINWCKTRVSVQHIVCPHWCIYWAFPLIRQKIMHSSMTVFIKKSWEIFQNRGYMLHWMWNDLKMKKNNKWLRNSHNAVTTLTNMWLNHINHQYSIADL